MMHTLDRAGDVILVLHPTATPAATTTSPVPPKTKKRKCKPARDTNEPIARFRVSSKNLCAASPVFMAMIEGPWVESKGTSDEPREIRVSEFDPAALLLVLRLMHHTKKSYRVPKYACADFDLFFNTALVCDYYGCAKLLQRQDFRSALGRANFVLGAGSYDEERLVKALVVSLVFRNDSAFRLATGAFIQHSRGQPLPTGQPLPAKLVEKLEAERIHRIRYFVEPDDFLALASYIGSCGGLGCSAAREAVLSQVRHKGGLFRGNGSFKGLSAQQASDIMNDILQAQPPCPLNTNPCLPALRWEDWQATALTGSRWSGFGLRDY